MPFVAGLSSLREPQHLGKIQLKRILHLLFGSESRHGCQDDRVRSGSPPGDAARGRQAGPRGQGDARPPRPQRHHPEVVRLADGHQGRRHRRQGDRAGRQVRGHGRQDGQGGRQQDLRRRRRRHDHGHGDGRGDLQRGPQGGRRRRQPHADEARDGQGGRRHRRAAQEAEHQGHRPRPRPSRSRRSPRTSTPRSAR